MNVLRDRHFKNKGDTMKYLDYADGATSLLENFNARNLKSRLNLALRLLGSIENERNIKPERIEKVLELADDLVLWADDLESFMSQLDDERQNR